MKQLKKICAYLMVFALAFMFTSAIIPAKSVKAASVGTVVIRTVDSTGMVYSVNNSLSGSVTGTTIDIPAVAISIDDVNPALSGMAPSSGYDLLVEYNFACADSSADAENGTYSPNNNYSSSATVTIPVPSGYTAEGAQINTQVMGTFTAWTPGTNSITFNVNEIHNACVMVDLKSASASSESSSATATEETPVAEETPAAEETPTTDEAPAVEETPAETETPTVPETPTVTETPTTTQVVDTTPATSANVQVAQGIIATAGTPNFSAGGIVGGNGVTVAGVSPITDGAALTQMTDLAARMVAMTGSQGPVTIQTAQAMDLNATGNGRVNFQVGSQFAGKVAVIGHYHDGVLYFQQRYVKANGTVDPYFSNFSPVIVLVTNQTTALADIPTSEPGATTLSAKSSSSTAPKTGESSANTIIFIIGMVALGAAIATYRKKSY